MNTTKNLTKEAPRSPRLRLGGYAIAARMIDKGRAVIADTVGEYHFACPIDQLLFQFKDVQADDVKKLLASGASDDQVVEWLNTHGAPKTADEITAWSGGVEAFSPANVPERKEWFIGECQKLGLDPDKATGFDYLDADDAATFKN